MKTLNSADFFPSHRPGTKFRLELHETNETNNLYSVTITAFLHGHPCAITTMYMGRNEGEAREVFDLHKTALECRYHTKKEMTVTVKANTPLSRIAFFETVSGHKVVVENGSTPRPD